MNKLKTYTLATIAALSLTYSSPAQEIFEREKILEKQEVQLNSIRNEYLKKREEATKLWNEAIAKQKVNITEQKEILKHYKKSEKYRKYYNNLIDDLNLEREKIEKGNDGYFKLMNKNINGFDLGKTELEKKINEDGIYLAVEKAVGPEGGIIVGSLLLIGAALVHYMRQ